MIYTYAAVAIASALAAGTAAWQVQSWRFDSERLEAVEQAREVEKMRRQAAHGASTKHENDRVVIREKFVPITKEVQRVITQIEYRDRACLTDDGVRVLNDAAARANGSTGEPVNAVPKPAKPK